MKVYGVWQQTLSTYNNETKGWDRVVRDPMSTKTFDQFVHSGRGKSVTIYSSRKEAENVRARLFNKDHYVVVEFDLLDRGIVEG